MYDRCVHQLSAGGRRCIHIYTLPRQCVSTRGEQSVAGGGGGRADGGIYQISGLTVLPSPSHRRTIKFFKIYVSTSKTLFKLILFNFKEGIFLYLNPLFFHPTVRPNRPAFINGHATFEQEF